MGTATATASRPMRADAQRNYDRIVQVASDAFAERGVLTSLDDIACRAGVGPGTLYRHFPTRDGLIAAALGGSLDKLAGLSESLTASDDPGAALDDWMLALAEHLRTYDNLPESIAEAFRVDDSPLRNSCRPLTNTTSVLVDRAKKAGVIRHDVDYRDLFALVSSVAWASQRRGDSDADLKRMLALATGGIR
ncbi:TetR/AcrR family transcriptional regulator [Humibacter ginsenosidimutans]|uniref:TetR/AcrR family transcriptional regulator n=1 Tax=Humibacter ginsenosidimutans TaxID=2599293 RepID=A0A5B8M3X1_9MICO|nr:TetR/AcrR family transcriptional regulator [Humibacter ginsenosidimutans]QDZ15307.1 TetR/AcrR family transcriptional regulator [Humibacter ginsenosidimutans]